MKSTNYNTQKTIKTGKRYILAMFFAFVFIVPIMTSCSKINAVPTAEQCLSDYTTRNSDIAYANFSKAEILRQQLNKSDKRFVVDVKITGTDQYAEYESVVTLTYSYFDNDGWLLDSWSNATVDCKVLKGRTADEIQEYLEKNKEKLFKNSKLTYISHDFNQANSIEKVYLNVSTKTNYVTTDERGYIEFEYERGTWKRIQDSRYEFWNSETKTYNLDIANTTWYDTGQSDLSLFKNNQQNKFPTLTITEVADDSSYMMFTLNGIGSFKAERENGFKGFLGWVYVDYVTEDGKYSITIEDYWEPDDSIGILLTRRSDYKQGFYKLKQ